MTASGSPPSPEAVERADLAEAEKRARAHADAETRASVAGLMLAVLLAEYDYRTHELEQADHFGRGEFRVTTWAYEQATAALEKQRARAEALSSLLRGMAIRLTETRRAGRYAQKVALLAGAREVSQLRAEVDVWKARHDHAVHVRDVALDALAVADASINRLQDQVAAVRALAEQNQSVGEFNDVGLITPDEVLAALDGSTDTPRKPIEDLIERSSLGTPEAKAARARVSDERVAEILARVQQLDAGRASEGRHDLDDVLAEAGIDPDSLEDEGEALFREQVVDAERHGWGPETRAAVERRRASLSGSATPPEEDA